MDKWLKGNKIFITLVIGVLVLAGIFYWFFYRPEQIRKMCYKEAQDKWSKIVDPVLTKLEEDPLREDFTKAEMERWNISMENIEGFIDVAYEVCLKREGIGGY